MGASALSSVLRPCSPTLSRLIVCLLSCCEQIADVLRKGGLVTSLGSHNVFGDEQLTVDISAENILREFTKGPEGSGLVRAVGSEEQPQLEEVGDGEFVLCWDPLDGSSIIGCNFSVGTIIGIWQLSDALPWKGESTLIGVTRKTHTHR
eukprot:GHVS01084259.1.p1 GENE.GHVS01084259.1~~GHVS01084259.1.p1  ORF type:complete len:149 (+),score=15.91 GHVS01084259.1:125-571(+)